MPNITRNDLTIEGKYVKKVLDAIGFNRVVPAEDLGGNTPLIAPNERALIDFDRIVPRPKEPPKEGWDKWISDNWGTRPYGGAEEGDIVELTDNKASFKFYTRWTPAFPLVRTLAQRFPEFKFTLGAWELTNHLAGDAEWQNGMCTLFVPMFAMKQSPDDDVPANDPVTDETRATAAHLVRAAAENCNGCARDIEAAEHRVADLIAASGRSVNVRFEANDDGSCCLCVDAR